MLCIGRFPSVPPPCSSALSACLAAAVACTTAGAGSCVAPTVSGQTVTAVSGRLSEEMQLPNTDVSPTRNCVVLKEVVSVAQSLMAHRDFQLCSDEPLNVSDGGLFSGKQGDLLALKFVLLKLVTII